MSHSLAAVLLSWLWWHYANLWTHSSMHATNHAHAQKHTNLPNPTEHCRRFNTHSSLSSCFCSSVVHLHPCRYCSFVPSFRNPIPSSCIYFIFPLHNQAIPSHDSLAGLQTMPTWLCQHSIGKESGFKGLKLIMDRSRQSKIVDLFVLFF